MLHLQELETSHLGLDQTHLLQSPLNTKREEMTVTCRQAGRQAGKGWWWSA